jgi:exopolyphosphatase/guanosine-5'-triphosphate,3'-diphosphate pyrophosphatase
MQVCQTAMREGVLFDMLGRAQDRDPRDASIAALAQRYGVDGEHAARVEATALTLFDQVAPAWDLDSDEEHMLGWAARIHEVGLAIAHSQHHVHGAYLIEHSDIAGFSRQEQQMLAAMVRNQRRSIGMGAIAALPERMVPAALRCTVLLRLAALLHRSHEAAALPPMELRAGERSLQLRLPRSWLDGHALTRADLETERDYLDSVGIKLGLQASG